MCLHTCTCQPCAPESHCVSRTSTPPQPPAGPPKFRSIAVHAHVHSSSNTHARIIPQAMCEMTGPLQTGGHHRRQRGSSAPPISHSSAAVSSFPHFFFPSSLFSSPCDAPFARQMKGETPTPPVYHAPRHAAALLPFCPPLLSSSAEKPVITASAARGASASVHPPHRSFISHSQRAADSRRASWKIDALGIACAEGGGSRRYAGAQACWCSIRPVRSNNRKKDKITIMHTNRARPRLSRAARAPRGCTGIVSDAAVFPVRWLTYRLAPATLCCY